MYKSPRGTKDILPQENFLWSEIRNKATNIFKLFDYKEIQTPIIEERRLFCRSLGQSTEIVQKQMFEIKRENDSFVLRPEGTAGIIRAYLENHIDKQSKFVKFYYMGAMFRAERPQKGRLRQFHHLGIEAIGSYSPYLDVETLLLIDTLVKEIGIKNYTLKLNSLGCKDDKRKLRAVIKQKLRPHFKKLCAHCKKRFSVNVLRVLDCKNPSCQQICLRLELDYTQYLCQDCQSHFHSVLASLSKLKIKFLLVPFLVRGLDYYTQTIFEVTHPDLGSQDAIGAGGRYDNLVHELGGDHTGAIGFALGMERLLLLIEEENTRLGQKDRSYGRKNGVDVYVVTLGREAYREGFLLLNTIRAHGVSAEIDYENSSLKGQFRTANNIGASFVIIIGDDELKSNTLKLKDMASGSEEQIPFDGLIENLKQKLKI